MGRVRYHARGDGRWTSPLEFLGSDVDTKAGKYEAILHDFLQTMTSMLPGVPIKMWAGGEGIGTFHSRDIIMTDAVARRVSRINPRIL